MASKRITLRSALRASSQLTPRASPQVLRCFSTTPKASRVLLLDSRAPRGAASLPKRLGVRWSTESATGSKIYSFEEIQEIANSSSPKITIIDTREPSELASTGRIPGSLNIPITTSPDSFHIGADEFEDRFGFERPGPEDEVVFYCKAGVRSRAAAGIAREAGWKNVGEYPGSWLDWSGKGGKVERS